MSQVGNAELKSKDARTFAVNFAEVGICPKSGVPIRLCYQTFGEPAAPNGAVLLIMGLALSQQLWDVKFCMRLASCGYYVIRFDNRDIGKSTILVGRKVLPSGTTESSDEGDIWEDSNFLSHSPPEGGADGSKSCMYIQLAHAGIAANGHRKFQEVYSLEDMAKDSVGLLDVLKISRAHIVGMCMGGMIAQIIAIQYPNRVESLSLISTHSSSPLLSSPSLRVMIGVATFAIRCVRKGVAIPLSDSMAEKQGRKPLTSREKDDLAQVLAQFVTSFASGKESAFPIDHKALLRQTRRIVHWSEDFSGFARQYVAMIKAPCRVSQLRGLSVPCVVIHGTDDLLVPYRNGKKLADVIPGSKLVGIEGLGHILHPLSRERIIGALVENMGQSTNALSRSGAVAAKL
ncbi:hydrolase, alpha/beta fold family, putative [Trypanosoma brucei gambiense DAL972]|uniref:Hydrolase, alpha/beta fold family, putative n=1 Tax=Trypanosoma brucei gambiense (strain MHOM/CI/86/DAL972) TaxID=679716 RepID=C9ZP69_TRYB9|nr:hydrolase, alpha/beta fold family, putative [Trypanosoma brucei gambiense DAL972]CBH11197.1 hydrolase, alpha/beta fold family, putative [Trypanosoma brucei gambiense DAL972]|eukprot:XP_011773484.1 hydrolase, alpha/beta fold family, putative [Trypanosoma brucei gambiense DAL972]